MGADGEGSRGRRLEQGCGPEGRRSAEATPGETAWAAQRQGEALRTREHGPGTTRRGRRARFRGLGRDGHSAAEVRRGTAKTMVD